MWKGLRLVKDILTDVKGAAPSDGQDAGSDAARIESTALHMLKGVSETMLTRLFEDCQTFAAHGKTKTIFVFDLTLAKRCLPPISTKEAPVRVPAFILISRRQQIFAIFATSPYLSYFSLK